MAGRITFSRRNEYQQKFPFPKKLICLIIKNANASVLQKLYRTCKYFYIQAPYFIVDSILIDPEQKRLENQEYNDCIFYHENLAIANIWVTKKLSVDGSTGILYKISKCTVTEFILKRDYLLFDLVQKLTSFGTIKTAVIEQFNSKKPEVNLNKPLHYYNFAFVEDMVGCLLNAENIRIKCYGSMQVTKKTMDKLLSFLFKNKIKNFSLENVDISIDVKKFYEFLKKNVDIDAKINLTFSKKRAGRSSNPGKVFKRKFDNFLNKDFEMPAKKLKLDVFDIEERDDYFEDIRDIGSSEIVFNTKNMRSQNFPFHQSFMNYLMKNPAGLKKLQKTCKYFFHSRPFLVVSDFYSSCNCTRLKIDGKEIWVNDEIDYFPQILVSNSFSFDVDDSKYFQKTVAAIENWDIPEIEFYDVYLLYSFFERITKSQNIVKWNSLATKFFYSAGARQHVPLEVIMDHLPKVVDFTLGYCHITSETMPKLLSLSSMKNRITRLVLYDIDAIINPDLFFQFISKSIAPKAFIKLRFIKTINESKITDFQEALNLRLESWEPKYAKPTISYRREWPHYD